MLGWNIGIYKQKAEGDAPPSFGAAHGQRLAIWQTGLNGLDWIRQLVKEDKAISLGGNGYPLEFAAMTKHIRTLILDGPPSAKETWTHDPGDILLPHWAGRTVKDVERLMGCAPEEWLIIEAWDES